MLFLLLLPLFISFIPSSSSDNPCSHMHEFTIDVTDLVGMVTNCSKNCSSVSLTETCKCFSLNVTDKACSANFFSRGLRFLHTNISSQPAVVNLKKALKHMDPKCQELMDCSLPAEISPYVFAVKLKDLAQKLSSA